MSSIKNDQSSLFCHFNKIIKGPGASFQSPKLSQKHVRDIFHTAHLFLTKFYFDRTVNNPEEISVRQSHTALRHNFFSKFFFDLKMPKMVFKQRQLPQYQQPNKVSFLQFQVSFFCSSGCCPLIVDYSLQDLGLKRSKHKCNFHYVAMLTTSQIFKCVDFRETQKSKNLRNSLITHQELLYCKK